MTPYNLRQRDLEALRSNRAKLADPGSGGTVKVTNSNAVLHITSTGARTLQDATELPLGVRVLVCVSAASVSVNSVNIGDGEFAEFIVTKNSSDVNEWSNSTSDDITALQTSVSTLESQVANLEDGVRPGTITAETDTATITTAEVLGGFILGTPVSAATYTLPTAALLVAAIPNCAVGMIVRFTVYNAGADGDDITLAAGAGATDEGRLTVEQAHARDFVITITNVTASSEAYVLYGVGTLAGEGV